MLIYENRSIKLILNQGLNEYYQRGEYAYFEFNLSISGFSSTFNFYSYKDVIDDFLSVSEKVWVTLSGDCIFGDLDSESYIEFKFQNNKLNIRGQLGNNCDDVTLNYNFEADQTLLKNFNDFLRQFRNLYW